MYKYLSILVLTTLATSIMAPASAEEKDFVKNTRQLTYEGRRSGEGYFSPDGSKLVFQSERNPDNPFYQIYTLDFETGDVKQISNGVGKTTCSFFDPKSDAILYASTHLDPEALKKQKEELDLRAAGKQRRYAWDYDENYDIFLRDGDETRRLTDARGYDAEGSFSPDGRKIVFCSMRHAYSSDKLSAKEKELVAADLSYFGEIYIMKADGSEVKRLTEWPGYDGGPFFTPDGKQIVWRHFSEDGVTADVYTMKLNGKDRRRLTDFASMCWAPYFHPSGKYAIFTTNKHGFGNFELYIVDDKGEKEPVRITYTDGFDGLPVFSPDGNHLAWTSTRTSDEKSQLFLADWDHAAALTALAQAPRRGESLPTSPATSVPETDGASLVPEITESDLRTLVAYLASDELEGRFTGSEGERRAAAYLGTTFRAIGLEPAGDDGTYLQAFPFQSGVSIVEGANTLRVTDAEGITEVYEVDREFRPMSLSDDAEVEGEVVFAGYGLTVAGDSEQAYDSYAGLDVKDKIVLVLRYVPEGVDQERRMQLNRYAGIRYKAMLARQNGAKGLLVVTGPNSPNAGQLMKLSTDNTPSGSALPVASITAAVADAIMKKHDMTLAQVQTGLDDGNPHFPGAFALTGVTVQLKTELHRTMSEGVNVVGYLPAGSGGDSAPVLVIGAHYDHLGRGESNSLASGDEEGKIHNGADDNASGTAVLVELAGALARQRNEHPDDFHYGIIFASWSGEELGIIGSNYYAANPTVAAERMKAYVNFDMVGRMRNNTLMLEGIGSSDVWRGLIEKRNIPAGFNLKLHEDPYLPTDVTAFYPRKIPVLSFFTGNHEDYHRPSDDAGTLDYEAMVRIGKFARSIITDLAMRSEPPAYAEFEGKRDSGSRASARAYLGTIPDYASGDIEGVLLTGVRSGGPADKGGMKGGDVIIRLGDREIKNVHDYSYALDAVKIGEAVTMVVLRNGKEVTLTIIPEARK